MRRLVLMTICGLLAVPPYAVQAADCTYGSGKVIELTSVDLANNPSPSPATNGYHLNVNVNGGPTANVLVDTGSNALLIPYLLVKGLPRNPADVPGSNLVVSDELSYAYGSSGNAYKGYLVKTTVTVNPQQGGAAATTREMTVYAVTQTCGKDNACKPVTASSAFGMMGIGFQPTPFFTFKDHKAASNTNVLAEIPDLPAVGYILKPDGITVGLNQELTKNLVWSDLAPGGENRTVLTGCFTVTLPDQAPSKPQCGTMLLDTGMGVMNVWQDAGLCNRPAGTKLHAGFNGIPFPNGTKVEIRSPAPGTNDAAAVMQYQFVVGGKEPGTPQQTMCSPGKAPHFNSGRLPLQVYSYVRNETCQKFSFIRNN